MLGAFLFSGEDADKTIGVMSGGERARVALAKLIANPANLLCMDEPTNHLDIHHCYALMDLVTQLECVSVVVLHDLNLAARYCDSIVLLADGAVVSSGTAREVLAPEIISEVYKVDVQRIEHDNHFHLVYAPMKGHS